VIKFFHVSELVKQWTTATIWR